MTVSDEAVEAAAKAAAKDEDASNWHDESEYYRNGWRNRMQVGLEAAAPFIRAEALEDLLAPESLERARKVIEDELIDWRDSGLFMLRNNGLAVRNKDGSGSEIIRFGFEDGLRIAVKDHAARAAEMRQGRDAES